MVVISEEYRTLFFLKKLSKLQHEVGIGKVLENFCSRVYSLPGEFIGVKNSQTQANNFHYDQFARDPNITDVQDPFQ